MLATATKVDELQRLTNDDTFLAEQKIDGWRLLLHIEAGRIAPVGRSGSLIDVHPGVLNAFKPFLESDARWCFDGEYLNNCYYVFDLIEAGRLIQPQMHLGQRREALDHFWTQWDPTSSAVELLPSARGVIEKAALVERVQNIGGEGVMFKRLTSVYTEGRRNASLLKVKFRHDIDCVVTEMGIEGKQNMGLSLWHTDSGQFVNVGECTALAGDGPNVKLGDVVTIVCHGASSGNRIVQPTFPKLRHDKHPQECLWEQLEEIRINKTVLT